MEELYEKKKNKSWKNVEIGIDSFLMEKIIH